MLIRGIRLRLAATLVATLAVPPLAAVLATATTGCATSNLSFVTDSRLHFVSPGARALVKLPVTVRWVMKGFDVVNPMSVPPSKRAGYFAIFVDRAPVKAGQTVASVADRSCRRTPGCANAGYLADRGVYTTTGDTVTIRQINSKGYQKTQTHEVTVVLLDSSGRRIGEDAWYLDFRMKKAGV